MLQVLPFSKVSDLSSRHGRFKKKRIRFGRIVSPHYRFEIMFYRVGANNSTQLAKAPFVRRMSPQNLTRVWFFPPIREAITDPAFFLSSWQSVALSNCFPIPARRMTTPWLNRSPLPRKAKNDTDTSTARGKCLVRMWRDVYGFTVLSALIDFSTIRLRIRWSRNTGQLWKMVEHKDWTQWGKSNRFQILELDFCEIRNRHLH